MAEETLLTSPIIEDTVFKLGSAVEDIESLLQDASFVFFETKDGGCVGLGSSTEAGSLLQTTCAVPLEMLLVLQMLWRDTNVCELIPISILSV